MKKSRSGLAGMSLLLLMAGLQACQMETSQISMGETLLHPNGLMTRRPRRFQAEASPTGFEFNQHGDLRNPMSISLSLELPSAAPPDISPAWFGLLGARYRITEREGGSGGTAYTIEAMQMLQNCWLLIKATQQSEDGPPTFLEVWAIFQNTALAAQPQTDKAKATKAACDSRPAE